MLTGGPGSALDPGSAGFQAANKACADLRPAGVGGAGGSGGNDLMLKFAECMRKNGVPNFPDPQSNGMMKLDPSSGIDPSSPEFTKAQEACKSLAPGGAVAGGSQ